MPAKKTARKKSGTDATFARALAPGMRVRVRDEEWMVEKCLPVSTGGYSVYVQGLTELVQHHKAIFLTALDRIEPLRPEDTELVEDNSPGYRQTRLFLETLLRRTPPTDQRIHIGHKAAIEVMPYQLVPARRALEGLRPRILIADGVGLGKTIEVGILLSELIKRGRGRRILVVAVKSMLAQFQEELWARFTIPLVRLDSVGLQRVQRQIPSNRNPFSHYDRCIISVDTLKNNARYRAWLEQARWDAVVVDECHNVANRGSQRERLARLLATTCESLILTSATPHNGRPESFANLLRMLDPTAVADERNFQREDVEHLFARRFKKDIEEETSESLQDRETHLLTCTANDREETALKALRRIELHTMGRKRHGVDRLFRWVLVKAFLSSPQACLDTLSERRKRIEGALETGDHPFADVLKKDLARLCETESMVEACVAKNTKLARFIQALKDLGFDGTSNSPRVVVFSERIKTLKVLEEAVHNEFGIKEREGKKPHIVELFHASVPDTEQQTLVEAFGKKDAVVRLLLASDAASEGINLHHYCNQLFLYDIPWSLIRLEQRMGRIDRFGQKQTPHLHSLVTTTTEQGADQIILEKLLKKEEQVYKQLGEAGVVFGLYDAAAEEDHVLGELAKGAEPGGIVPDKNRVTSPETVEASEEEEPEPEPPSGLTILDILGEGPSSQTRESISEATASEISLYDDDFEFACAGLSQIEAAVAEQHGEFHWKPKKDRKTLEIWAPESFQRWREPFLPREARPEKDNQPYKLAQDPALIFQAIDLARQSQGEWPEYQLLWEQHPVIEWLLDGLAAAYGRNEAPCLAVSGMSAKEGVFLFQAVLSNEAGQPVLAEWFGIPVGVKTGRPVWSDSLPLEEVANMTGLSGQASNKGKKSALQGDLKKLVPDAVERARSHVVDKHQGALTAIRADVRKAARKLGEWKAHRETAIDLLEKRAAERGVAALRAKTISDQRRHLERQAADHQQWLESLQGGGEPYVRLCAVFSGEK